MSPKESRRVHVMEQVMAGSITIRQAAEFLNLSPRQIKRLKRGMREEGVSALAHKNRGRKPKHAVPKEVRKRVVELVIGPLRDTSCQHVAELLEQHYGIRLSAKTVRRVLAAAGIPIRYAKKARRRRKSRERMPRPGLLAQCDASPYAWLEERAPKLTLHGAVDDATSKILALHFRPTEDAIGYFQVLSQTLQDHGIPAAWYTDRHTIFFSPKKDKLSVEEELAGQTVPLTQFGQALNELGIAQIAARSPEAKGRIERLWETLQSRLVVEMRLAGISTIEEANAFLHGFIEKFNDKFAEKPADPTPAFRPSPPPAILEQILCFKEQRKASKGSSISYLSTTYQLTDPKGSVVLLKPEAKVLVLTHLDGSHSALFDGERYGLKPIPKSRTLSEESQKAPVQPSHLKGPKPPSKDHPWRQLPIKPNLDPVEGYYYDKVLVRTVLTQR